MYLLIAQLVERMTVVGWLLSSGRWFDSGSAELLFESFVNHSNNIKSYYTAFIYNLNILVHSSHIIHKNALCYTTYCKHIEFIKNIHIYYLEEDSDDYL